MNIMMVGTGYVGLVTGTCFAEAGHEVVCVDVDAKKVAALRAGVVPIYEPGLSEMVARNAAAGRLSFTTDMSEATGKSDIAFIAVGTPMGEDGRADLRYVRAAAREIGRSMTRPMIVVDKSTVPVGTADEVRAEVGRALAARGCDISFEVVSNPEFLKEGSACADFLHPDRVVIGTDSAEALAAMRALYAPFLASPEDLVVMDTRSAEMTKYASNSMLAARISFMNELAQLCERTGADVERVRAGMARDGRIGAAFLAPGCGYGGSCFPKDVSALIWTGQAAGCETELLGAVQRVNARQKRVLAERVCAAFGEALDGRVFAVWGLAFKPETDDMREAASVTVIRALTSRGARVQAYDPQAMETARAGDLAGNARVAYGADMYEALDGADALLVLTEWEAFRTPDFDEMKRRMKGRLILDGRNVYYGMALEEKGFSYQGIGVERA